MGKTSARTAPSQNLTCEYWIRLQWPWSRSTLTPAQKDARSTFKTSWRQEEEHWVSSKWSHPLATHTVLPSAPTRKHAICQLTFKQQKINQGVLLCVIKVLDLEVAGGSHDRVPLAVMVMPGIHKRNAYTLARIQRRVQKSSFFH